MDPRVRASLERLRDKVETALRAASIQPTKSSLTGATDNVRTSVARFTSSGRSHPKTYRGQLRTAVIAEEGEDDEIQVAS
ncbi:unnamed protein product [Nippostrongylus brasiliensis]|uniref:Uncharacterized protein n=1 Tax=Nippostrongylus brasiliensis TaxID=27835 RepID=A0A0N4XKD5_NIPBR|nr:unnamed protein product [Nippostrongylus brasiliensis]